uniref:Uncharacterized protein n=1 Tax=Desertifilum tharense IPPAS B-1220 TaxID=1781255 RepID=A0ACD5GPZ1_9CYAN
MGVVLDTYSAHRYAPSQHFALSTNFPPPPHLPNPPSSFPLGTRNSELCTLFPHPPILFPTRNSELGTLHSFPPIPPSSSPLGTRNFALFSPHLPISPSPHPLPHSALSTQHFALTSPQASGYRVA